MSKAIRKRIMGLFDNHRNHYPGMDARRLKDGTLRRYKSGLLGGKWKEQYVVLYSDSTLSWFDEKGDSRPAGSILLKDVVPYICVGLMTDKMPVRRPSLPAGTSVHHVVGIGMDPRGDKVHWFLFGSDADLESWFAEIVKTLPKPNPPPGAQSPQDGSVPGSAPAPPVGFKPNNDYNPPAQYPPAPPPYNPQTNNGPQYPQYPQNNGQGGYAPRPQAAYGGSSYGGPGGYGGPGNYGGGGAGGYGGQGGYGGNAPGGYPASSGPTTIIVDRDRGRTSSGIGSGALGLGTGMLGGALLGYGLGSFFTPHYGGFGGGFGGGYGGGYGGPGGFGGGYYSDNDTTINNYYNTNDNDTTTNNYNSGNDTNDTPIDNYDVGGGYDDGGFDTGGFGGDDGGFDVGGGDFGGADFGDF